MKIGNLYKIIHKTERGKIDFYDFESLKSEIVYHKKRARSITIDDGIISVFLGTDFFAISEGSPDGGEGTWHCYYFYWDNKIWCLLRDFYDFIEVLVDD